MTAFRFLFSSLCCFLFAACGDSESESKEVTPEKIEVSKAPPKPIAEAPKAEPVPSSWTEVKVHEAIRKVNPDYTGNAQIAIDEQGQPRQIGLKECRIKDLSWIVGMPLVEVLDLSGNQGFSDLEPLKKLQALKGLYLENTRVKDISPLKGKRLEELYLTGTLVTDLSPFSEMQVNKLNLVKTPVTELKGLAGAHIGLLWLTDCPVTDISGLEKVEGLESVTLHRTKVSDLSPLVGGQYPKGLRLHIAETPVKDLTPLGKVPLTRLVFTPGQIVEGLDEIKQLPMLREIGTQFDDAGRDLVAPQVFWENFGK